MQEYIKTKYKVIYNNKIKVLYQNLFKFYFFIKDDKQILKSEHIDFCNNIIKLYNNNIFIGNYKIIEK